MDDESWNRHPRVRGDPASLIFAEHVLMDRQPAVYMLGSRRNGTLYTGVTSDLTSRIWQHKQHLAPGFTHKHDVTMLVWYALHPDMESAILREKRIKKWHRAWKIELIETMNPYWNDLWYSVAGNHKPLGPRVRGDDEPERFA